MAAAFVERMAGERYEPLSAGVEPAAHPRAEAVAVMAEDGIVIADTPGTALTPKLAASSVRVVGLGCDVEEVCGPLDAPVEQWGIPDPGGMPMPELRVVRDTIRRLVERLVARMDTEAAVR